jgi:hypothetical protein
MLAAICGSFVEGFGTVTLREHHGLRFNGLSRLLRHFLQPTGSAPAD